MPAPTRNDWPPPQDRRAGDGRDPARSRRRAALRGRPGPPRSRARRSRLDTPRDARAARRSRSCAAAAPGSPRAMADARWSIASRLAKTASARTAASRKAAVASAGRPASRSCPAIRANRVRLVAAGARAARPAGLPRSGGATGAGARRSSIRRRRRASGRGRSRTGPMARPDPGPRERSRGASTPPHRRSSPPRIVHSPPRTVARSNERPMTAAADRICAAVSPTEAIRSRSSAWTSRGMGPPGDSPLARAATTWSGSPSESAANASIRASSTSPPGRDARTIAPISSRSSRPRTRFVAPGTRARSTAISCPPSSRSSRRHASSSTMGRPARRRAR